MAPSDPRVRLWFAAHLGRLGRSEEALRQIREGLALKPADMLLNHQLATEYFRQKRYTDFLVQSDELVRLQPFQANSHLVRARALERLGRYEDALDACRTAEKFNLERSQLVLMMGIIETGRGRYAKDDVTRRKQNNCRDLDQWMSPDSSRRLRTMTRPSATCERAMPEVTRPYSRRT
jgi:Flp pilus assembly protein TadD